MDIDTNNELETKAGIPPDSVVTHAEMMRAFEEFKESNDQRLTGIERRRADVLVNEKLTRIDRTIDAQARRLDEIALKNFRPIIGGERLRGGSPSTRRHLRLMYGRVRTRISVCSKQRLFPPAPIPMAAFWCRRKSRHRSISDLSLFRRSARLLGRARLAAICTKNPS